MRILLAANNYYPNVNGGSIFPQRLAEQLSERGHTVLVVAPSRSFSTERYAHCGADTVGLWSVPILVVRGFRFCLPFTVYTSLKKIVEEFRPDVIHVQDHFTICANIMRIGKALNIPVMATNHFMPENIVHYLHLPSRLEGLVNSAAWYHCSSVYNQADCVTSPTPTAAQLLMENGLQQKAIAVSCGIDLTRFHPGPVDASLRARYGAPEKPLLLFVGRLDKEKCLDVVLHACAEALKKVDFHLVLGGQGAMLEQLQQQAQQLGIADHVTFLGYVPDDDLPALYRSADGFVIASIAELQSLATLEAMASGLPVIGANAMALPELVHDGENGFLFPAGDHHACSAAIVKLLSDPQLRIRMGHRSLEIARTHTIEHSLTQFTALYRSLTLENARPAPAPLATARRSAFGRLKTLARPTRGWLRRDGRE